MSYDANEHEVASVTSHSGPERFSYFLSKVTDWEEVWSLADDEGWALSADESGRQLVPIWPAKSFASACCVDEWARHTPRAISVADWIEKWTPGMTTDLRGVAVFPTPADSGIVMEPQELANAISEAMEEYE